MTLAESEKTPERSPESAQLDEAALRRLQDDLPDDEVLYDLAELFRALEDKQEWASLSFSVLERASDGKCAARAYANLGQYFLEPETENVSAAVGCARLALRLAPNDAHTTRLLNKIHAAYPDAAEESDEHVMGEQA